MSNETKQFLMGLKRDTLHQIVIALDVEWGENKAAGNREFASQVRNILQEVYYV